MQQGYIGVYPTRDQVRIPERSRDRGFEYFGLAADLGKRHKMGSGVICKTCGVSVFGNIYGPPIEIFDKCECSPDHGLFNRLEC